MSEAPGTVFAVELRSAVVRLGTMTAGDDGTASGTFTVPAYAGAGVHAVAMIVPGGELTAGGVFLLGLALLAISVIRRRRTA